jgi:hypothetical protein
MAHQHFLYRIDFNIFFKCSLIILCYFGQFITLKKNLCNFSSVLITKIVGMFHKSKAKMGVPGIRAFSSRGYLDFEYLLLVVFLIYQRPAKPSRTKLFSCFTFKSSDKVFIRTKIFDIAAAKVSIGLPPVFGAIDFQ